MALNIPAAGVPYFTPAQDPPAGTAIPDDSIPIPSLFRPITIRGVTFQNRIFVSPMCQYSAENGLLTPWHFAHLGGIFTRGPGLTFTECTAVLPEGRISPEDAGIWSAEHAARFAPIVEFAHSQSQKIGIQLGHAGRKASTIAPAIPFSETYPKPNALDAKGIRRVVDAFREAAERAVSVGFDAIEIHAGHGYLISTFLSPTSNKRTDEYGGSFENRIRFALEVVDAIRSVMPDTMPLISGSEGVEEVLPDEPSWRTSDTVRIAPILAAHGVDILDVSAGGINLKQKFAIGPAYQAYMAYEVKKSNPGLLVATVGGITDGHIAQAVLDNGQADLVLCGRAFQQNPGLVLAMAQALDVDIQQAHQIQWGYRMHRKPKAH
ncbi:FMN-linked oxidoreductase [Mucidula mucida]|nr:FMN-linked oxidoreductase [Mucidula mucida]